MAETTRDYTGWDISINENGLDGWMNGEDWGTLDRDESTARFDEALLADVQAAFPGATVRLYARFTVSAPEYDPNEEHDIQATIEELSQRLVAHEPERWMVEKV